MGLYAWWSCLARHLTAYYYSGRTVLIALIMEEEEEMIGRQYNGFEKLGPSA